MNYFDVARLRQHWSLFSGTTLPFASGVPMFAGFTDFLVLRTSLLKAILADVQVLEQMWHEIALPTAILHQTSRIGWAEGIASWGEDRKRFLKELMSLLDGVTESRIYKATIMLPQELQPRLRTHSAS